MGVCVATLKIDNKINNIILITITIKLHFVKLRYFYIL